MSSQAGPSLQIEEDSQSLSCKKGLSFVLGEQTLSEIQQQPGEGMLGGVESLESEALRSHSAVIY